MSIPKMCLLNINLENVELQSSSGSNVSIISDLGAKIKFFFIGTCWVNIFATLYAFFVIFTVCSSL